jgi:hypothetical protein
LFREFEFCLRARSEALSAPRNGLFLRAGQTLFLRLVIQQKFAFAPPFQTSQLDEITTFAFRRSTNKPFPIDGVSIQEFITPPDEAGGCNRFLD